MAAIKTFRELVAGGAYNFMNLTSTMCTIPGSITTQKRRRRKENLSKMKKENFFKLHVKGSEKNATSLQSTITFQNNKFKSSSRCKHTVMMKAGNTFFERLDDCIKVAEGNKGKRNPTRRHRSAKVWITWNWLCSSPNQVILCDSRCLKRNFMEHHESELPCEDEDDSAYGGSIDLQHTDGEDDSDGKYMSDNEDDKNDSGEDKVMQVAGRSGTRGSNENYEEFDDNNNNMKVENFGKGTYSGGLTDDEWNMWQ
ncbi:hypothetical protein VP01_4531g1 [Puccinia sorghi]|uniref:Uncharacterized protein n=1 Tax=Puccinia sorghi TaxID=27349 RepID=A0A0L6UNY7_9BASI|nr:hypothetical protein VP01_4531g1 [Puccinia sorghi]